jgi:hypothetical protein
MSIHKWVVTSVVACLWAAPAFSSPTSDFERLLANPQAFDGKRVTIVGIADVYDVGFFLCQGALSPYEPDLSKAVFVVGDRARRLPDNMNKHWLKVTGIVNARAHGPMGDKACEVVLDRFEVMPRPILKERRIFGVFRNETPSILKITVSDRDGFGTSNVAPGTLFKAAISGEASVEADSLSGKSIAKLDLEPMNLTRKYFDSTTRTLFYRVTAKRIEPIPAVQGKHWLTQH